MAAGFVSCKSDTNKKEDVSGVTQQAETSKNTENEEETDENEVTIPVVENAEKFTLGKISENDYINESAGFKITGLDEKWKQSSPQEIANVYDSGIDPSTGKAYSSNSDDGSQNYLYDVLYTNSDSDEVISVSLLEYSGDNELNDVIPINDESDAIDGFLNTSELIYLEVAGKKTACKKITYVKTSNVADIPDVTDYEIYLMSSSCKQVIKIVVVCFEGEEGIEDILKHFEEIKNE